MNTFQTTLYANLMALCSPEQEAFYYVDQKKGDLFYRIFLYRLASYTEFLKPGALECRGHTFRIDEAGNALELASMPMAKFFGYQENPMTMGLDLSTIDMVMDKLDGSLISSVLYPDGTFFLKSKGSFGSEHAKEATRILDTPEYAGLKAFIGNMAEQDITINMELLHPELRIVIGYQEPALKVLNARYNHSGRYIPHAELYNSLHSKFVVDTHAIPEDGAIWIENVYEMTGIEGFVFRLADGLYVKLKGLWYKNLHHCKDSVTIPRRLFEACVNDGADELRTLFTTDSYALNAISEMEDKVSKIYNHIDATIHAFYSVNKESDRKTYAIAGQADAEIMRQGVFGLVMNLYLGKEANVEEFMIKNYKKYGIKDEAEIVVEAE